MAIVHSSYYAMFRAAPAVLFQATGSAPKAHDRTIQRFGLLVWRHARRLRQAANTATGEELRDFITRLVWSLPLRQPSPVDSAKLRRAMSDRTGGITLGICEVIERAAIGANPQRAREH